MTRPLPLLLLLASCGEVEPAQPPSIECAVDGATRFERSCGIERVDSGIVLHHPSGGFRRLRITGVGLVAADGADPASLSVLPDGRTEVAIAGDRYRIPAAALGR